MFPFVVTSEVADGEAGVARWWAALQARARSTWDLLGPGVVTMAAGIGTSHFLLAPTAGAAFGYALAWTVLAAHLVKYPAFDYASRYTHATGESLLSGFADLGPGKWAVGTFGVVVALEGGLILAGVASVAASALIAGIPALSFGVAVVAVCGACGVLLWVGAYDGLERAAVAMLAIFASLTFLVGALAFPDPAGMIRGSLLPSIPTGALLLAGGLLGYMPAPLELGVMKSIWQVDGGLPEDPEARRAQLPDSLTDFRVGYATAVILGLVLVGLGASLLQPRGLVPEGPSVITTISRIYRSTLGEGVVPLYLLAAFLGMFATLLGVIDGFPRAASRALEAGGRKPAETESGREIRYWGLLYATFGIGVTVAVFLPEPATLVSLAATATVLLAPLWYLMIVLCVHGLPEEDRPPRRLRAWAWAGLVGMTAIAAAVAWLSF